MGKMFDTVFKINKNLNLRVFNNLLDKLSIKNLNQDELKLISDIQSRNLTYLGKKRLVSIIDTIKDIKVKNIEGGFMEAGCALGGSSILISKMKKQSTPHTIYDVFGLIPAPDSNDTKDVLKRYETITKGESKGINGEQYYGYRDNLYDTVVSNLKSFGITKEADHISMVQGKVQDTMKVDSPVAFAHIDVDWYNSTMTCLEQIWPNLVVGGSIIIDDYDSWGGCRKATDEYFGRFKGQYAKDERYGSLKITRTKA